MKTAKLVVRQAEVGRLFPDGFVLLLEDEASVLDAVRAADEEILKKYGRFPVDRFKSLMHMVYYPCEERFCKQVAVQAYTPTEPFLNIGEDPKMLLPNDTTVVLVPEGGCTTDWEQPMTWARSLKSARMLQGASSRSEAPPVADHQD